MAVPAFNHFFRPVLEFAAESGEILTPKRIREGVSAKLSLTKRDLSEKTPKGYNKVVSHVGWVLRDLKYYAMLENPAWGQYQITQLGREFLAGHPGQSVISEADLEAWTKSGGSTVIAPPKARRTTPPIDPITAEDQMEISHQELQDKLSKEILDSMKGLEPDGFERLVVKLLEKMGYGDGRAVGQSGDGGIDGILTQDTLGLEKVYIQAKKWGDAQVGSPVVNQFSGALLTQGASKGVLITTSTFSGAARQSAQKVHQGIHSIRLIDGQELAALMIRHGVGVVTEITYEVKKLDANYFAEV